MLAGDTILNALDVKGTGAIGRAVIDGAVVIYDLNEPPVWFAAVHGLRDDDGNTPPEITSWEPCRPPREGEYADPQPVTVPR